MQSTARTPAKNSSLRDGLVYSAQSFRNTPQVAPSDACSPLLFGSSEAAPEEHLCVSWGSQFILGICSSIDCDQQC